MFQHCQVRNFRINLIESVSAWCNKESLCCGNVDSKIQVGKKIHSLYWICPAGLHTRTCSCLQGAKMHCIYWIRWKKWTCRKMTREWHTCTECNERWDETNEADGKKLKYFARYVAWLWDYHVPSFKVDEIWIWKSSMHREVLEAVPLLCAIDCPYWFWPLACELSSLSGWRSQREALGDFE